MLAALAALPGAQAAPIIRPSGPYTYTASSVVFDYKTQRALLRDVVITRGPLKVTADRARATGLDFKHSRWTFTGHVRISAPHHGLLTSQTATIEFRNERMQTAVVTGRPAKFEQTVSKTGVLAHGHANSILYTVAAGTVKLQGDAWLHYGANKISAPVLTYDIASQKLEGAGAGAAPHGGRVHITIRPKAHPGASARAPHEAPLHGSGVSTGDASPERAP